MKIRLIDQDLKAQGNQSLKAYLADQERGAAPEKVSQALLDEFSRLMDKISAKVDAKKPEFSLDAVKTPDVVSQQAVMKLEKLKVETDNKKLVKAEVEINKDKAKLKPEAKVLTKDQKQEAKTSEDQIEAKNENHVDNKEVEVIEKEVIAKDEVETEIQEEQITEEEILDLEIENEILIAEDSTKTEEATEIEINTQDISKAASQEVNKSLEQETKKEVSTDEIETEELSDVKAAKNLNQDNDKQQQKPKVDAEKDLVTNEKSVKKDKVTEELPVEAKTSNPQFNDQKPTAEGNIHAKVEAAVDLPADPIQAAAEKVIQNLLAQQLSKLQTQPSEVAEHTNKLIGLATAHANLTELKLGGQSGIQNSSANSVFQIQNTVSATDRSEKSLNKDLQSLKQKTLPKPLQQHTLEKVKEVLKEAASSRDGKTLSLRLDPPSLGNLRVDVTYKSGSLHARLIAESPQVSQFLREKAQELQMILRKIGINADSVSVSVSGDNQGFGGENMTGSQFSSNKNHSALVGNGSEELIAMDEPAEILTSQTELDHWVA